jgi:hypothetical protein
VCSLYLARPENVVAGCTSGSVRVTRGDEQ